MNLPSCALPPENSKRKLKSTSAHSPFTATLSYSGFAHACHSVAQSTSACPLLLDCCISFTIIEMNLPSCALPQNIQKENSNPFQLILPSQPPFLYPGSHKLTSVSRSRLTPAHSCWGGVFVWWIERIGVRKILRSNEIFSNFQFSVNYIIIS